MGLPQAKKTRERDRQVGGISYNGRLEAWRPQAGSLPRAGLRDFVAFSLPKTMSFWGDFFFFWFPVKWGKDGGRKRWSREKGMEERDGPEKKEWKREMKQRERSSKRRPTEGLFC